MVLLMKIIQVVLALSLLIVVHELGHFTFAKIFGIRVDKFFLFFDVNGVKLLSTKTGWFSKLFPSLKEHETEYGIGWLPLGGYCKICGMVDESLDLESLASEPQPWEFRTKKAWQRLLVMAGGVLYNFLFAILAYICILDIWGQSYFPNEGNAIYVNELSYDMGFRSGDRILKMDDYVPDNFGMLQADLARRDVGKVTVLRDGDTLDIYIDHSRIGEMLNSPDMFDIAIPFIIDSVTTPNEDVPLLRGDRIVGIDSVSVPFLQDARDLLQDKKAALVNTQILREGDSLSLEMKVDSAGRLGVFVQSPPVQIREYNFFTAVPAGLKMTFEMIGGYLDDLRLVFTPSTEAYKSVGSFIAIGQAFPGNWDSFRFMHLLALLSIILGVMNLIPIPGLDGGHILFTLYEMITGRSPGEKFLVVAQMIGMILIFGLMILAIGNDIGRLVH